MIKNKWDESFAKEGFVYGVDPNQFIEMEANRFKSGSKIACLAEGEGRNAVYLAKQGHDVTAYDISNVGLNKASKLAENNGVSIKTKQMNLIEEDLPKNAYDHAILVFGHVHKKDQATLINNLIRTVKKGGLVMFEVYSDAQLKYKTGGPGKLEFLYAPKTILDIIDSYECLHFYYGEAMRHEGSRHNGLGHVIQVIIKK